MRGQSFVLDLPLKKQSFLIVTDWWLLDLSVSIATEHLFTLILRSCYRRTETLFQNMEKLKASLKVIYTRNRTWNAPNNGANANHYATITCLL